MPTDRLVFEGSARAADPWIECNDALTALSLAEEGYGITVMLSYSQHRR
jgi:hypothetical protein